MKYTNDRRLTKLTNEKNPENQLRGFHSHILGASFEKQLDGEFESYRRLGQAVIVKTPEPMKVVRSLGSGRFEAIFEKKAQPDYEGTIAGGLSVVLEAKFTQSDRINQSRVSDTQAEYMEQKSRLGALCYVIVGFSTFHNYMIPWNFWRDMKSHVGHKYLTEAELSQYNFRVSSTLGGRYPTIIDKIEEEREWRTKANS